MICPKLNLVFKSPFFSKLKEKFINYDVNQSAFIQGRLITDNILAAFETLHSMQTRMWDKVGFMSVKLDISKAYDRVEWPFLEAAMTRLGFADRWVQLVMTCVQIVSYSVIVNGNRVGKIITSRGIRQGNPISLRGRQNRAKPHCPALTSF